MKILVYFSGKLMESRGTPIRVRNQIKELQGNGFNVYYAGHDAPEGMPADHIFSLQSPLARFVQLTKIIRKEGIDIVYIQTSAGVWYVPWLRISTHAKIGIDFHSRRFQEEHVYRNRPTLLTALFEGCEMVCMYFLHFSTVCAATLKEYYYPAIKQTFILPVGVDTTLFTPEVTPDADILAWKGDSVLLGYAGNTKWYQGVEGVLTSFARVVRHHNGNYKFLIIASSGSEDVLAFVKEQGIEDHVRVLEQQPHSRIPSLLAAADILTVVRPSDLLTKYSFPSKIPEYAALGKALIVSLVSDVGSYVVDGENGIVVPPEDEEALEKALLRLGDPALRKHIAEGARTLAVERFDLHLLGRKLSEFLVSLA